MDESTEAGDLVDAPTQLQHIRVAAQFRLNLFQLIKRRLVVAQLQPAMGGLEVVAVGWQDWGDDKVK